MIGHPTESRLIGFLDGSLADGWRRKVAGHLAECQRCRDIVQAHRLHRLALTGEPSAAPAALFDRVLATRASGGGVILPVDLGRERRGSPFTRHHFKVGAMVAAGVAALVVLTRIPLPNMALGRGLDGIGETLQEVWSSALRTEPYAGPPRLMERLDAPAAVLDPSRMRELTARYETRQFEDGELKSIDSGTVLRIRHDGELWRISYRESGPDGNGAVTAAALDAHTLAVTTMTRLLFFAGTRRGGSVVTREYTMLGPTALRYRRTSSSNIAPPSGANRSKPRRPEVYEMTPSEGAPLTFDDWGLRVALMTAMPIARNWFGALDDVNIYDNDRGRGYIAKRSTDSRRVRGGETLTLPIGKVKAWRVERWQSYGVVPLREYYRQSDGLLVAERAESAAWDYPERRLLSVSYP